MKTYKSALAEALSPLIGQAAAEIEALISVPQIPSHGDFSFPCFTLAKQLRKAPPLIAKDLADRIALPALFTKAEALSGYLNVFVDRNAFARDILLAVAGRDEDYGKSAEGAGRTVVVDFSSPNMGKELAFHHLRGTMVGHALANLHELAGYRVVRINHVGDWGTIYGKLIAMFRKEGLDESEEGLKGLSIERLNRLYQRFTREAAADPALEDEARFIFQKLEEGDAAFRRLWAAFRETTLVELQRLYAILGVRFDHYTGEAFFVDHIPDLMERLEARGLVKESQGAHIVDLSAFDLPPLLLKKSDGATLYATRDLAAAIYRQGEYAFDRALYVVDNGQSLHFQQVFKTLELLGLEWFSRCEHVPFGLVLIRSEEGKWEKGKTKAGNASLLKDVIEAAEEKILAIMREKNPEIGEARELARDIAVGALVFDDIKNRRLTDIRFDWDKVLSFEGDTGPYVLNAHVRLCSILRKAGYRPGTPESDAALDFARLTDDPAQALIQDLARFEDRVAASVAARDPYLVAQYLLEIAEHTHAFLHSSRVLGSAEEKERLFLVHCAHLVLRNALRAVGMKPIEAM